MSDYDAALAVIARDRAPVLSRSIAKRFPGTSPDVVDECVQDALLDACTPERAGWFVEGFETGGADEIERRLYTAAWRRVRGEHRKVGTQRTARLDTGFDARDDGARTEERADTRALMSWLRGRVDEASERFGRTRQQTLRRALSSMVDKGHRVKPVAERYALPRRYLTEASVWLKRRLADEVDEDA